jgi:patatin-like phospholipase/acyl hydrolase
LLFFENGVVYGLSALYVLRDIMDYANSHKYHTYEDRKPCDVFDLIGGTGTGGQVDFLR